MDTLETRFRPSRAESPTSSMASSAYSNPWTAARPQMPTTQTAAPVRASPGIRPARRTSSRTDAMSSGLWPTETLTTRITQLWASRESSFS